MATNDRKFIPLLSAITDIVVGEASDKSNVTQLPLLLLYAEQRQQIAKKDYEDWITHVNNIIICIKEIDKQLKQIGGHKADTPLKIK